MNESTTQRPGDGSRNRLLGILGEDLAAAYLTGLGYRLLDRNWRDGRRGELDLVVCDGGSIVAVEVKTRRGTGYGSPFEAITLRKAQRLRGLLHAWVREHRPSGKGLRVDAVGITLLADRPPLIEHLRGIS